MGIDRELELRPAVDQTGWKGQVTDYCSYFLGLLDCVSLVIHWEIR